MRALLLGITLLAAAPALAAEKYVGSNVDVRTVLAFKVADAAVQKFLPDGWQPDVVTAGPAKDVNLRVTFIDRIVNQDAAGKALEPVRIAHLSIPAKMKGSQTGGTMLFRIYSSSAGGVPGPYGVSVHAPANMERKVRIDPAGIGTVEEFVGVQVAGRQFHPAADSVCARRVHARQGGNKVLFGGQAGILPHLPIRAVHGRGSQPGSRPGAESPVQSLRSDALAAVRRLGATDRRHLGSVVYPADLPSGIVSPRAG